MATSTEEILLRLGMSADGIKTGMAQANASVKSGLDNMKTMFVQAFSGVAILGAMNKVLNKFDEIQDRADNLGVGTDFLQGMQQVAKRDAVGGQETFNRGIGELAVRLGSAKDGSETAIKAFQKFGITLSDISKLDVEGMFYLIADRIKAIPDPAQRAAAAFELLGKSGKNLTGVLSGGAAQLKNMVDQADKLAAADVKRLADAKDQIEDYNNTLTIWGGKLLGWTASAAEYYGENLDDLQAQQAANTEKNLQAIQKVKKAEQDAADAKFATLDAAFQVQMKTQAAAAKSAQLIKEQLSTAIGKRDDIKNKIGAINFESVSVEDLAGKQFAKERSAMYGEGGQFDLTKGTGKAGAAAREFLAAKYAQQYSRVYGTTAQAEAAQNRMNAAEKTMEKLGVKLPGQDIESMKISLDAAQKDIQKLLATAIGSGIKISDAK